MVTTFYPPYNFGGDGIYVYRLTNALARQGHEVHVLHDLDAFAALTDHLPKPAYPSHPNVVLYPLSSRGAGPVDLLLTHQLGRPVIKRAQIRTILEQSGFDVIHFHNVSLMGGPHVLEYGQAIKLCTLHDYWFVCAMHVLWRFDRERCSRRTCLACSLAGHRPPQWWRYTGGVARAARQIDAFIGPSQFTCDIHAANGFPAPIRPVPHFLPEDEVRSGDRTTESYRHPRPFFLFVGRLEKIKGVQVLLEVFRTYQKADLVIAGTGTYEAHLREMAKDLPHVHFTGLLDQSQLHGLYLSTLATLISSLCYESFGWVTLESFARHTPVIVNDVGALPEVVRIGGGGLIYRSTTELVEAMEILRTQPDRRQALGEQGYHSYQNHFTEERHLKAYYDLIEELSAIRQSRRLK
jgi:glycosyltransferase involved in cell wall biosynthesis